MGMKETSFTLVRAMGAMPPYCSIMISVFILLCHGLISLQKLLSRVNHWIVVT